MSIVIGIDPGTNTGFAVWNLKDKAFELITTYSIHRALEMVSNSKLELIAVIIEDARLRKFFGGKDMSAQAQGAGSIKRDCSIWEDFLTEYEIPFILKAPQNTKVPEAVFKKMTGWDKRTSNHARDAAMLVFGLTENNIRLKLMKIKK